VSDSKVLGKIIGVKKDEGNGNYVRRNFVNCNCYSSDVKESTIG
jgi:hypothetical protein